MIGFCCWAEAGSTTSKSAANRLRVMEAPRSIGYWLRAHSAFARRDCQTASAGPSPRVARPERLDAGFHAGSLAIVPRLVQHGQELLETRGHARVAGGKRFLLDLERASIEPLGVGKVPELAAAVAQRVEKRGESGMLGPEALLLERERAAQQPVRLEILPLRLTVGPHVQEHRRGGRVLRRPRLFRGLEGAQVIRPGRVGFLVVRE